MPQTEPCVLLASPAPPILIHPTPPTNHPAVNTMTEAQTSTWHCGVIALLSVMSGTYRGCDVEANHEIRLGCRVARSSILDVELSSPLHRQHKKQYKKKRKVRVRLPTSWIQYGEIVNLGYRGTKVETQRIVAGCGVGTTCSCDERGASKTGSKAFTSTCDSPFT